MLNISNLCTKLDTICYICKIRTKMEVVSARNFRANQTNILTKALKGESILLSSRIGMFKITPVTEEDTLTTRICNGLKQVKMIQEGKLPRRTIQDMLDEL